jgi:hypothetical protein
VSNDPSKFGQRVIRVLVVLVLIAIGVRIVWEIIFPVLPALGVLAVISIVGAGVWSRRDRW